MNDLLVFDFVELEKVFSILAREIRERDTFIFRDSMR
jgi:hypothetical protein